MLGGMPFIPFIAFMPGGAMGMPFIPTRPAATLAVRFDVVRGCLPVPILGPVGGPLEMPDCPRTRWRVESWLRSKARLMWPTRRFSRPPPRMPPARMAFGPVGLCTVSVLSREGSRRRTYAFSSFEGASVMESRLGSKPASIASSSAISTAPCPLEPTAFEAAS